MVRILAKMRFVLVVALALSFAGPLCMGAIGKKKVKVTKVKPKAKKKDDTADSAEPDKVLYERAMGDIKHARFTDARLDLQTLINTYPDSEYLAKAKLAVADSYYKEGGTSNLTQAVEEYKNFEVFFPFLDEASYAQMQVGMAHYRMMEKADRDNSQAEAAEDEFRAFLLKYPQSPLVTQAEQYLRNVQEVLADGEFRIARFYYTKQDFQASAARLVEVSGRYPLFSQSDEALSMLGNIYLRAKQVSKNEDQKNHWADLAAQCYDRIVKDYPLSRLAPDAKARLASMGMPVPAADPGAVARMQDQQMFEKQHHPNVVLKFPLGMVKSNPDVYAAAHTGQPNLNPPDDTVSATEVLNQGAAGPTFNISARAVATGSEAPQVDTESVDSSSSPPAASTAAQIIEAPAAAGANPNEAPPASSPATADSPAVNAIETSPAASTQADTPAQGTSPAQPAAASSSSQSGGQPAAKANDPKTESSSKKKKGLHKLVPW